jgi:hypothetical protein
MISQKGVAMDLEKIEAMLNWPILKNIKALWGFLGLTGYYRKFISKYGEIARPFTQLLKKDAFRWSPLVEHAFDELKKAMTQAPVLTLPDFSKGFVVECDASGSGIRAILMQERCPIAYFSQALQGRNLQLSTYEKEMLALVTAVQKWRPYLFGNHFIIRIDHQSLQYLWKQSITTTVQRKWLVKLLGYDFSIEYKKGVENTVANTLSRKVEYGELVAISDPILHWLEPIQEEVASKPQLQELVKKIEEDEAVGPWEYK